MSALPCSGLADLFQPPTEGMAMSRARSRDVSRQVRTAWEQAKTICRTCPRREQCLADELVAMRKGYRTLGVHGGTDPLERMAMLDPSRLSPHRIAGRRPPVTPRARKPINHGTHAGYVMHLSRGEQTCDECRAAHTAYRRARKAASAS